MSPSNSSSDAMEDNPVYSNVTKTTCTTHVQTHLSVCSHADGLVQSWPCFVQSPTGQQLEL